VNIHAASGLVRACEETSVSLGTQQNVVSSIVQLTVGTSTTLLLNVTRDFDSTRHVFTCELQSGGSLVTQRKTVTLKLNSTVYSNTTTNGVVMFVLWLSPQADSNQTVYNVVASFAGDSASTATASMTLLNGTSYAVCTTTQYNTLKPSSNSTSITVTPQTTMGTTTLKSSDQLQTDAKNCYIQLKSLGPLVLSEISRNIIIGMLEDSKLMFV
jgi:hypothetical protein